jgi:hypothetical protein
MSYFNLSDTLMLVLLRGMTNTFVPSEKSSSVDCELQARKASGKTSLVEHVIAVHHKVRVTKGSDYRWAYEGESR